MPQEHVYNRKESLTFPCLWLILGFYVCVVIIRT